MIAAVIGLFLMALVLTDKMGSTSKAPHVLFAMCVLGIVALGLARLALVGW